MSRKILGLDWFDVVVHVGVTMTAAAVASTVFGGRDGDIAVSLVLGGSLVLLGWRRQRALARLGEIPPDIDRVEELESRLGELEQMQYRVADLEERLDFAERLLGQQREQERLPRV